MGVMTTNNYVNMFSRGNERINWDKCLDGVHGKAGIKKEVRISW